MLYGPDVDFVQHFNAFQMASRFQRFQHALLFDPEAHSGGRMLRAETGRSGTCLSGSVSNSLSNMLPVKLFLDQKYAPKILHKLETSVNCPRHECSSSLSYRLQQVNHLLRQLLCFLLALNLYQRSKTNRKNKNPKKQSAIIPNHHIQKQTAFQWKNMGKTNRQACHLSKSSSRAKVTMARDSKNGFQTARAQLEEEFF